MSPYKREVNEIIINLQKQFTITIYHITVEFQAMINWKSHQLAIFSKNLLRNETKGQVCDCI